MTSILFPLCLDGQLLIREQDTPAAFINTKRKKRTRCTGREENLLSSGILQASPIGHLTDPPFQSCKIQIEGAPARSRLIFRAADLTLSHPSKIYITCCYRVIDFFILILTLSCI